MKYRLKTIFSYGHKECGLTAPAARAATDVRVLVAPPVHTPTLYGSHHVTWHEPYDRPHGGLFTLVWGVITFCPRVCSPPHYYNCYVNSRVFLITDSAADYQPESHKCSCVIVNQYQTRICYSSQGNPRCPGDVS